MESNTSNNNSTAPSSVPRLQFVTRAKNGIKSYLGPPDEIRADFASETSTLMQWSDDGALIALLNGTPTISIYDAETFEIVKQIDHRKVAAAAFSPKKRYLVTWERLPSQREQASAQKDKEESDAPTSNIPFNNLIIWDLKTGEQAGSFVQKVYVPELWPSIRFSPDEKFAARMVSNEVHFYQCPDFQNVANRLKLPDIAKFSISPNETKWTVAAFVKEKKGAPGFVRIFDYPSFDTICSKSFYKAQEVDLLWNSQGTSLLIVTHTDVDKSGKSYYGETGLHYLQADGKFETNVVLKKEGPIHDCVWSPTGKEFAVVYGFMPAQTTIFNIKCEPIADIGTGSRNTCKFSPSGKLICVAGFGNLQGYVDIWDWKKLKKLGSWMANYSAHYEWSPDGRYIITAVLFPRMKVDNGFKVWRYDGTLVYEEGFQELYQVNWQPLPYSVFPDRPPSPRLYAAARQAETEKPPEKVGKYVPPHLQGRQTTTVQREQEGPRKYNAPQQPQQRAKVDLPVGYSEDDAKKKQKKKKKKEATQEEKPSEDKKFAIEEPDFGTSSNSNAPSPAKPAAEAPKVNDEQDKQKKIKAVQKKLRQIEELKEQQKQGKQLDALQQEKIKSEASLKKELQALGKK